MTTYSISLDDVDLALLPRLTHNNFLKKDHYQFQVIKEHAAEVPELTSDITYTCHICALEVPSVFAREHAASIKHQTNARIASVATQRMHALITASPPSHTAKTSARFCTNCTAIVDDDHEKTKEHRVAVMHDNLLSELMKAYVGEDETKDNQNAVNRNQTKTQISKTKDDNQFKNTEQNINSNDAILNQMAYNKALQIEEKTDKTISKSVEAAVNGETIGKCKNKEITNVDITENNIINSNENDPPVNLVMPTTSRWFKALPQTKDVVENGTVNNTITNSQETKELKVKREPYEKELRKFMDNENQFEIKEMYHRMNIKTHDTTVNVYSDHFHSFHKIYKTGEIECIVCDIAFNEKDSEAHKYSLNHMSGVVKIGGDADFVREITDAYSHCILCNQKINNVNVANHKTSQHHKIRKTNNVRSNVKPNEATTEKNINENKMSNNTNTSVQDIKKQPYEERNGELWCPVCDCRVPRDVRNREDHVKGLRHMNNLKS